VSITQYKRSLAVATDLELADGVVLDFAPAHDRRVLAVQVGAEV